MQYINNNSDFSLDIALKAILPDGAELATAPPNCDFTLTFGTRYDEAKYEVGRYNGEPRGYTVNTDGSLHVIFDAHGLGLGRLGCMLTYGIPDSSYPDGMATVATSYELDVELIGWGADGQQSGTVTLATEAAAVSAAQQAQAAAEQAAGQVTSAVDTANEAKTIAQQAEAKAESAVAVSKAAEAQAVAAVQTAEASRQAAEQSAAQATQAQQAATAAAGEAAQSAEAVRQSATAAAQSAEQAAQAATSAAQAVERADSAIATATAATESANAAAQAANTAADNANTAADSASEYVERYDAIAGALPKVTDTFEGVAQDTGLRYVIRKNKLIAILKDWQVIYAPEGGIALVDAIAPTSFSIGNKVYNVPAGVSYVELGLTTPITAKDMYQKVLYQNVGIRGFGLYLDGSQNTSLGSTFELAADLEWLDISGMDTKAVTFGIGICNKSTKLRKIYGKWQLPKVELASNAFISCSTLEEVDVSEAGMDKCRDLGSMFKGCSSLTALDVSGWNTAACTNMQGMFYGCSSLTALDVSGWDTAAVTNMSYMFNGCSSLTALDVSGWDTAAVTNMSYMFNGCSSLTALDVSGWDTAAVTNMSYMFNGCSSLTALDASKWGLAACPSAVTMFAGCSSLASLDVSAWDPAALINTGYMFTGCSSLTTLSWPMMGKIKADATNNKSISLSHSPLDRASLDSIFAYDRTANGLTNPLTVYLSKTSKALLTPEEIAAITAKGYTIA